MNITLDIDNASSCSKIPNEQLVYLWVYAALKGQTIEEKDEQESAEFNQRYRNKQGATNVLSFPADLPDSLQLPLLGDLIICAPVVEMEAHQQKKTLDAHWAHIIIHGSLHLIGFDHIHDQDAEEMEALETNIITGLNFPPPYEQSPGATNTQ